MLTIARPTRYGYRSVHDLPTPPSASKPSPPPLSHLRDRNQTQSPVPSRYASPPYQPMSSVPHRGLPPPAALALSQPAPSGSISLVHVHPQNQHQQHQHQHQPSGPTPPVSQNLALTGDPVQAIPHWSQLSEESQRLWFTIKVEEERRRQEEEKRKQEEERTRQESYRLEQKKLEHDILRTSLQGGIPPHMVPVIFAGMGGGGGGPQQAGVESIQQYAYAQGQGTGSGYQGQGHSAPALMPPGAVSPDRPRRDSQAHGYAPTQGAGGVPSTPGSAQGPLSGGYMAGFAGSPGRSRGHSLSGAGALGRPVAGSSGLPGLNTNVGGAVAGSLRMAQSAGSAGPVQQAPPEAHHPELKIEYYNPSRGQSGNQNFSEEPSTSLAGESPRKRKATGPQSAYPAPASSFRRRSPPFSHGGGLEDPPPGRKRGGHARQRSDLGSGSHGRGQSESVRSPAEDFSTAYARRDGGQQQQQQQHQQRQELPQPPTLPSQRHTPILAIPAGTHSVSSLLSGQPSPHMSQHAGAGPSGQRFQSLQGQGDTRKSPPPSSS